MLCVCLILLSALPSAWAHTHRVIIINGQKVEFVVGWFVEPPYAGEINAVDVWAHYINSTCPQGTVSTSCPVYGLDQSLRVQVTSGGQSQILNLSPNLSNDVPPLFYGEYTANVDPLVPGTYSFTIFGTVRSTPMNETFTCGPTTFECVDPASEIQFPQSTSNSTNLQSSNAQLQISNLQSEVAQMQSTLQMALAVAAVGVVVGIAGVVIAVIAMNRSSKQAQGKNRKRT